MRYQFSMDYFQSAVTTIASTMGTTLCITFVSFLTAFVLAVCLALLSLSRNRGIQACLRVYLSLFRGTPLLAQLFFFVYGLFPQIPLLKGPSLTVQGIACLSISFAAPMSETLRGAIQSVDRGQMEACLSCGMTRAGLCAHRVPAGHPSGHPRADEQLHRVLQGLVPVLDGRHHGHDAPR